MKAFFKEFRQFISRGNVIDLAVGVMIGTAFSKITTSLVNDVFMPLLSLVIGRLNLADAFLALDGNAYPSVEAAKAGRGEHAELWRFCAVRAGFFADFSVHFLLPAPAAPAPARKTESAEACAQALPLLLHGNSPGRHPLPTLYQ